jgi:signal transduction histidine kinase/ABC-type multidrug transport system ATPase subunit
VAFVRAPVAGSEALVSVQGLAVNFGPVRALDGVDFEIRPGEAVALAGENGAGKSTLIRCIAGDWAPSSGEILIDGRRISADPGAVARQGVAVVWQDLALCDNLDIASNLLLGGETGRLMLSDTRFHITAASLLRSLRIPLPDTTRNVRSLSGGQRQLLAVARAMRDRPRLLILDEPTASLGVAESAQVEELIDDLRRQGTSILMACHDIDQMFRLVDRIAVLRHGRVVADVDPAVTHPDDVVTLISGQQIDSSARRQLSRLHGLADRLASADPSSSLPLILSALSAALGSPQLSIHLLDGTTLRGSAFQGFSPDLEQAWSELPYGSDGGPVGVAAATRRTVVDHDVRTSPRWSPYRGAAADGRVGSSWAVPVMGPEGLTGVITVLRPDVGHPDRDELDLVTVYAGYAAGAVERDRLLGQVTARNRVLETIREVLETLAGPVPLSYGLAVALDALREGLQADEVGLIGEGHDALSVRAAVSGTRPGSVVAPLVGGPPGGGPPGGGPPGGGPPGGGPPAGDPGAGPDAVSPGLMQAVREVLSGERRDGRARRLPAAEGGWCMAVSFSTPEGPTALVASWQRRSTPPDGEALMEDAANSLRLALEREESERAQQEAAALRRSQELQRGFLSRLSHELRTPLTAIRGYASSLMQPDVTWDGDSEQRFLSRMAAESSRLGRLVDDLLDFSAIESGILRLQRDWCDLALVLDAAVACFPPASAAMIELTCPAELPVIWADHDRLEQVFVNLFDNALRHNPPGTHVTVTVAAAGATEVVIDVADDGLGVPEGVIASPFESRRRRRSPTAGAGLGLSITKGIVEAHGGRIELDLGGIGTRFRIHLPVESDPVPVGASATGDVSVDTVPSPAIEATGVGAGAVGTGPVEISGSDSTGSDSTGSDSTGSDTTGAEAGEAGGRPLA